MPGRVLAGGLVAFALLFGAALWWFQTHGYYEEVTGVGMIRIDGQRVAVTGYEGVDAATSPLKLRACFRMEQVDAPPADGAEPLVAPDWFGCFDAKQISNDLDAGAATALLAASNEPYGFDRIVAYYPDGRGYLWRQINDCGTAAFAGDPVPEGCPPPPEKD